MFNAFKKLKRQHQIHFAIVIGVAVVAFWRGVWGLLDLYLFPQNELLSYVASTLFGIIILSITHYITKELE